MEVLVIVHLSLHRINIMFCRVLLVYSYQIVFLDNVLFEANRQVREAS